MMDMNAMKSVGKEQVSGDAMEKLKAPRKKKHAPPMPKAKEGDKHYASGKY